MNMRITHSRFRVHIATSVIVSLLGSPIAPLVAAQAPAAKPATPAAKPAAPAANSSAAAAATTEPDGGWPRAYTTPTGAALVAYQPQVASWTDQKHIVLYAA